MIDLLYLLHFQGVKTKWGNFLRRKDSISAITRRSMLVSVCVRRNHIYSAITRRMLVCE